VAVRAGLIWYVAQTRPCSESRASLNLLRQGFEVYLPRYLKKRRHARKVEIVSAPLFPSYLFVAFDRTVQNWLSIRSTIGVRGLVCHGDDPAVVPSHVIDELRGQEDGRGFIQFRPPPQFAPGDRIRVTGGVFSTCLGSFDGMADKDRVAILLDLLGRKVRVLLGEDMVAAA
jgi:transcriptional antiterminator RfaH